MKKIICILLSIVAVLLVACSPKNQSEDTTREEGTFAYAQKEGQQFMLTKWKGSDLLDDAQHNRYSLPWPEKGMLSDEAEQELLNFYFGDMAAATFEEAAKQWVMTNWYAEDFDVLYENVYQDTFPQEVDGKFNFCYLDGHIEENGNLVLFWVNYSTYMGGAHGISALSCLIYDRASAKIIELEDLVDTTDLGKVIATAINGLDVNKNVRDEIYIEGDEPQTEFFVPSDFYIDSTRSAIVLIYQVYDIACYASGRQEVALPASWLAEQHLLTPYAKELFKVE